MFLFHVEGVEGAKMHSIECMCEILYKRSNQAMLKKSKILKQALIDSIEFILFHVEDVRDVYNVYELQCIF